MFPNLKAVFALADHGWDEETVPEAWGTLSSCGIVVGELDWPIETIISIAAERRKMWRGLEDIDFMLENQPPVRQLMGLAA